MALPAVAPVKKHIVAAPARPVSKQIHTDTVARLLDPDRALVNLTDGQMARIDTSRLAPGISPQHLLCAGQRV